MFLTRKKSLRLSVLLRGTKRWLSQEQNPMYRLKMMKGISQGSAGKPASGDFTRMRRMCPAIRHTGEAADEDRIDLIYKATQYGKNNGIEVLFFESNGKVMFETELRLKTEVYLCKTYFVFMGAVVLPLFFSVLFIVILGCGKPRL